MSDVPAAAPAPPPPAHAQAGRQLTVVFEDEDIVVEWTAASPPADAIAVTFDPISVGAQEQAYAAGFLQAAGVDTLCVRKKHEHFYQALSRERFDEIAGPILSRYQRRFAYGSSLGAYAVLYFCGQGFETVISSSPRVSAHPRLGRPHWQSRVEFRHDIFSAARPATSGAVIFYDPHDALDRMLVDEEIRLAWPHATYMPVAYSGHPTNQFLSEIGFIAPFVRAVVASRSPPRLDRRANKARSWTYHHMLAVACLRHDKAAWAERLCRRALELKPGMTEVLLAHGQALLALGRGDEAEPGLLRFKEHHPHDRDVLQALEAVARERNRREAQRRLEQFTDQVRQARAQAVQEATDWRDRGLGAMQWLKRRLRPRVSRDEVLWCYRHLLGRAPESDAVVESHLGHKDLLALAAVITGSREYAARSGAAPAERHRERLVHTIALAYEALPEGGRLVEIGSERWFSRRVVDDFDPAEASTAPFVDLCIDTADAPRQPRDERSLLYTACQRLRPGGHVIWAGHWPALQDARQPVDVERLLSAAGLDPVRQAQLAKGQGFLVLARKPA